MVEGRTIAFTVQGVGVTAEQRAAGIAAMTGSFTKNDVRNALIRAGVPVDMPHADYIADRAADRLCQAERKAGRIRAINNKNWERVA